MPGSVCRPGSRTARSTRWIWVASTRRPKRWSRAAYGSRVTLEDHGLDGVRALERVDPVALRRESAQGLDGGVEPPTRDGVSVAEHVVRLDEEVVERPPS